MPSTGGRTDETGIAAEMRITNLRLFGGDWKSELPHMFADAFQKPFARRYHAAGENHHVRIDGVQNIGYADRQIKRGIFDDAFRQRIPAGGGIEIRRVR